MTKIRKTLLMLPLLALSACATMFGDSSDQLTIRSNDPAAKLIVNGNQVGTGSAVYSLRRGKEANITASKPGCSDTTISTDKSMVGAAWLNILFWPGFIVDAATGRMFEADPTSYTVNPNCQQ
jgi:hypothetical protein